MTQEPVLIATFGFGQQNILSAEEFGNKAAGIAALSSLGIPVPPGFALSTSLSREYFRQGKTLPAEAIQKLREGIMYIEKVTGSVYGGKRRPLLISVRSGAPVSMPGVMDTVLNVGLTQDSVRGLIEKHGNPRFGYDTYRRFMENFGVNVFGHDPRDYHTRLRAAVERDGVADERELDFMSLRTLCQEYTTLYTSEHERNCLSDAACQLESCTAAVLGSWMNLRAIKYRKINSLDDDIGTAVCVQAMVFGNTGRSSGAGVAFTRNPWTGANELLVDFRFDAQGEDVVSGSGSASTQDELQEVLPDVYHELVQIGSRMEAYFTDMQDLEFTVQEGILYLLQCRSGKRSPLAELRIAVELWQEGVLKEADAIARIRHLDLKAIEFQSVRSGSPAIARGVSASGGVVYGSIAFTPERAVKDSGTGPVILVRETANPDDIAGIHASAGILTAQGARTSHAAVVARHLGKVCVVNCLSLVIDRERHRFTINDVVFHEGDTLSIDGNTGDIYSGRIEIVRSKPTELLGIAAAWKAHQPGSSA